MYKNLIINPSANYEYNCDEGISEGQKRIKWLTKRIKSYAVAHSEVDRVDFAGFLRKTRFPRARLNSKTK